MKPTLPLLLTTLLGAAALAARVSAQPPGPVVRAQPFELEKWQKIRIRNVSPRLMLSWLDPAHYTAPLIGGYNGSIKPDWAIGRDATETASMLSLPAGVQAVTAVDAQNLLWVLGTETGIAKMVEKVALLDKPLRHIEVQAQWVQISESDVKALGIDFAKSEGKVSYGLTDAATEAQLKSLLEQKRAKIITAPRVTAILGSTASLYSTTSQPAVVGIRSDDGHGFRQLFDAGEAQKNTGKTPVSIGTSLGLAVTPSLDKEENVTLELGPLRTLILSSDDSKLSVPLKVLATLPSRITLKDAQTMAFQGLKMPLDPNIDPFAVADSAKTPASNVLVLVTARILRRAGEER